jgi:hypothetical protein
MGGDLKEVIGALMRALDGGKISRQEVEDLAFEAAGELQLALNEAYITLLEFAYDCDAGLTDQKRSEEMRAALQQTLDEIIRCSDPPLAEGHEASDSDS